MKIRTSQAQQKILRYLKNGSLRVDELTEFQRRSCEALKRKHLIKIVADERGDYLELV